MKSEDRGLELLNVDEAVVSGFGLEWRRFDQTRLSADEREKAFDEYFAIFPWKVMPENAAGFDAGCGTGRWAALIAQKVGHLHCVDASGAALAVAKKALQSRANVSFHQATLEQMPMPEGSMDFGYSLGVLHHVPDPAAALAACVRKLKPGAPFLLYIYYKFDNRPLWFRACWRASDLVRRAVSAAPFPLRSLIADSIAAFVYWPLARLASALEARGRNVSGLPLAAYRWRSFYTMRTDALDRFGTALEHRMTRDQIAAMMKVSGLRDIIFSDRAPFWCAIGLKA